MVQTPAPNADLDPLIEAYKKDVEVTLIRENLKLTLEERLNKLYALQQLAVELHRAGQTTRKPE